MPRVQELQWELRELYDRRRQLHELGDAANAEALAAESAKAAAAAEARQRQKRRKRMKLLRRPNYASVEIQRRVRGFLARQRRQYVVVVVCCCCCSGGDRACVRACVRAFVRSFVVAVPLLKDGVVKIVALVLVGWCVN